jgi:hypothetical protein
MAVNLSPVGGVAVQFFTNSGAVLTGGKIFTYAAGTTTPQTTFTNAAGNIPHSNPIILDASGRVPGGEIWLTDGFVYKFLLKDANDVLIGTYDNIIGINSNFVNFTNDQEIQTATAGQTVFTLTTTNYQPGTNSLSVFVDGVNQYGPGAQYAYLETNSTTVTFISGLHVGAEVKFTTSQINSSAATSADQVSYLPAGVGAVPTNVQTKLRESVSVKDFGAVGDGVADDTLAIYAAIQAATNGLVFEGTFLLASAPPYTGAFVGAPNAYIPIISKNGFKIDASRATFIVDYDFVANTTSAALFAIVGSENVVIDAINCYAPSNVTSQFTYGIEPLVVTDNGTTGSKNVYVSSIDCENVAGCINVYLSGGDAEYIANGFNSAQRSSNIYVANARMENGSTLSEAGYGITLQLSGDNTVVDNARFINTHRSIIAYGVQVVKAKIWNTDSAADNISIGSYGSISDFDIFLKDDGTDNVQAISANIASVSPYDTGTPGGGSLDILAGRTHVNKNIKIEFDISVAARAALCFVGKEGGAGSNSNIVMQNITLSGIATGVVSGLQIGRAYISPSTLFSNTVFENIVVRDMRCNPSSNATVRSGFTNALVFENYFGNSVFTSYDGAINEYPIIFRNCSIENIMGSDFKDFYAVLENSHINKSGLTATKIQPFNKQFFNTRLGNSEPINKRQHDIYSDINDTGLGNSLSQPQNPKTNLVGGAFFEGNNTDNPIDLDLIAIPAAAKATSTISQQIDHFSFVNTTDFVPSNSKLFNLYVRDTAASIAAFYTGHLVLRGTARTDFSACTILFADLSVTNILGSSYVVGDLTVSAPDADTIRFSMSRPSELINLVIYDN